MDKNKAKEFSDILLAYYQGKTIQVYIDGSIEGLGVYKGWKDIENFDLDCLNKNDFFQKLPSYDYESSFRKNGKLRIKPQPKLVPFTFEDNLLFRDKWIIQKEEYGGCGSLNHIVGVNSKNIIIINSSRLIMSKSYDDLLKIYTFEDGSPCGKYINE